MVKVIALNEAREMNLPGRRAREIISAANGAQNMTVRIVEIAPEAVGGGTRGPHMHENFEECIHVLEGEGVTRTDTDEFPVHRGDTVLIAAGERHATYNTGTDTLKLLCFFPVADIRPTSHEYAHWVEGVHHA